MESARADMMADVAGDYRDSLVRLCYNPKFDQEMLQHWVSGTGDFKGSPLKARLENMERLVFTPLVSEYIWQTCKKIIFVREPKLGTGNVRTIYLNKFAK